MALAYESIVRQYARTEATRLRKSATAALNESVNTTKTSFDVFLSHSKQDAEIVFGAKVILEKTGLTVYVDWIDDPLIDRSNVSPATAEKLRMRMRQSKSLFYLHSGNATKSRWMPWELGFFDGFNGNVAVLPIAQSQHVSTFKGEEFLGLYPYVDITNLSAESPGSIYIHKDGSTYNRFEVWRSSTDKLRPMA